jgi:hypothetical protein
MADEENKEIESPGETEQEEAKEAPKAEPKEEPKEEAEAQIRYSGEELDKMTVKKLREIGKKMPEINGAHAMKKMISCLKSKRCGVLKKRRRSKRAPEN